MPVGKYGDWDQLRQWQRRMESKAYKTRFDRYLRVLGREISDRVKHHIRAQDLGWTPLSPVTIRRKGSDTVYVETGEYYRKIRAKLTAGMGEKLRVVVATQGRHLSGMDMQELARILEYGTSTNRARPLWRPTFAELDNLPSIRRLKDLGAVFDFGAGG